MFLLTPLCSHGYGCTAAIQRMGFHECEPSQEQWLGQPDVQTNARQPARWACDTWYVQSSIRKTLTHNCGSENTLNKLYSAQRNQRHIPTTTPQSLPIQPSTLVTSKPQKSTLHSFWKQLPAPPVQPIFSAPAQQDQSLLQLARCEDCDAPLQSENDSMDIDMDTEYADVADCSPFACNDCGRNVCGTCAVVSATRHCLQCATTGRNSRRWW